ncbi:MAG: hypothetical protein M9962_02425 [Oligoflexia bacterium]|nr:hypothetical protein [Oligoflexia bacterium]
MFILGLISIIQICFLPGYLLLHLINDSKSKLQILAYSYFLSFLVNYTLACTLTFFSVYTSTVIYLLLFIELIFLAYILYKNKRSISTVDIQTSLLDWKKNSLISKICIGISILSICVFTFYIFKNLGTIFQHQDEIGSYNYWATQWIKNKMPSALDTMGYPVSASANWSLGYLILNNSQIQFFNKISMTFFPVATILLFIDIANKKFQPSYLISTIIFYLILRMYTPYFIGSGPLDVAVSCIIFAIFHSALELIKDPHNIRKITLLHLLAASAASLKQSGLFAAIIALVFTIILLFKSRTKVPNAKTYKAILISGLIFTFLSLFWYIRIQYLIYEGLATSESTYLIKGIHGSLNYTERFWKALDMLFGGNKIKEIVSLKFIAMGSIVFLNFVSLKKRLNRFVFLFFVFPYFFIWAFLFSYEPRTLAPIFPFLAINSGAGIFIILESILNLKNYFIPLTISYSLSSKRLFYVLLVLGVISAGLSFTTFSNDALIEKQVALQKKIMDSELNQKLYQYEELKGFSGKIASLYGILKFLPGLEKYYFHLRAPATYELINYLENREDIHYLLLSIDRQATMYNFSMTDKEALDLIEERLNEKKYELIFKHNNLGLIKIR